MKCNLRYLLPGTLAFMLATPMLTSCLKDDDDTPDYTEWRKENEAYVAARLDSTDKYDKFSPVWAPDAFVLIQWHSRPEGYSTMLRPMDNSLVDVKYCGRRIDGTVFDSSYPQTANGDSIYRTKPNSNVLGFWATLTQMVPGDSVTVIIPARYGYGATGQGKITPFTTLIFDLKLKKIVKWDAPQ